MGECFAHLQENLYSLACRFEALNAGAAGWNEWMQFADSCFAERVYPQAATAYSTAINSALKAAANEKSLERQRLYEALAYCYDKRAACLKAAGKMSEATAAAKVAKMYEEM